MMKRLRQDTVSVVFLTILLPTVAAAQVADPAATTESERLMQDFSIDELLELGLEELQQVHVTSASLTSNPLLATPAAVTIITEDDIRLTPARNLCDLIEIYVPGAQVRIHSEGLHPGFRGILSDRNLKILLVVNGRVMNQLAHNGATTELENWDLNDVAQVEVIRGPGSVTYGPGALSAVISITTKSGRKSAGTRAHLNGVSAYRSAGLAVEHGFHTDDLDAYAYVSVVRTAGWQTRFFGPDGNSPAHPVGIFGEDPQLTGRGGQLWMNDTYGEPQMKAHLQLVWRNEWKLWSRFTTQGTTNQWYGDDVVTRVQTGLLPDGTTPILGSPYTVNSTVLKDRQFATVLENDHRFGNGLSLKSMASYDTIDFRRGIWTPYRFTAADSADTRLAATDPDSALLYAQRFAEEKLFVRSLASLRVGPSASGAIGASAEWQHWGPGWGDSPWQFRMGEIGNIVAPNSPVIGAKGTGRVDPSSPYITATSIAAHTTSAFAEADVKLLPRLSLLVSGRVDKSSLTDALWSGRAVASVRLAEMANLRLIAQVAQRMNTVEQLILENALGPGTGPVVNQGMTDAERAAREAAGKPPTTSTHETLKDVELLFSTLLSRRLNLVVDAFYNQVDIISFNGSRYATEQSGSLSLGGVEAELVFATPGWRIGLNHAQTELISWKLAPSVTRSGISYSDYNNKVKLPDGTEITLLGSGHSLNNWANATKFYANARVAAALTMHVDAQFFWSYPGVQNQVDQVRVAVAGTSEAGHFAAQQAAIDSANAAGFNVHVNASVQYQASETVTLSVYGFNLTNTFRRYHQDAGNGSYYPQRVLFMREPMAFGATARVKW